MIIENQMSLLITDSASLSLVLDPQHFSDIQHLFQVTAWKNCLVNNCQKGKTKKCGKGDLTSEEIDIAENMWIKEIQGGFTNERLKQLTPSLGLFLDKSGIIQSKGRLGNTSLPYQMKYPSLLDPEHHLTRLRITSCHQKMLHNRVKETLIEHQTRYWLIKGRQWIKRSSLTAKHVRNVKKSCIYNLQWRFAKVQSGRRVGLQKRFSEIGCFRQCKVLQISCWNICLNYLK